MPGDWVGALLDLIVPAACPGCGRPGGDGTPCRSCRAELATPPQQVTPRVPVPVPVHSCGTYAGVRRRLILEAKEHGSGAARRAMGATLAAAIAHLAAAGAIEPPSLLVPAPTRAAAARRRGGDPVLAACREAAARLPGCTARRLVETRAGAADSAGLGAADRRRNLAGQVRPIGGAGTRGWWRNVRGATVIVVDDVLTTGATAAETILVLTSLGVAPSGVMVVAHA